jgi:hypothetical protein
MTVTAGPDRTEDRMVRKHRKREAKLLRDATRPPRSLERWRILMDVADEGRRVAELADHKARYALVVMGALNAGVFLVLSRAHLISDLPPLLKPWLIGVLVAYAGLSCLFVYHAIQCLRPRWLRDAVGQGGATGPAPLGLLYWESIANFDEKAYRKAWNTVRMDQLNGEVVVISHHLALLIRYKYRALARLYRGLAVLVILAALQLLVYGVVVLTT